MQEEGFSDAIIDRFFRPFLGGIFFDRQLGTTSRLFAFVMRMLATGACWVRLRLFWGAGKRAAWLTAAAVRLLLCSSDAFRLEACLTSVHSADYALSVQPSHTCFCYPHHSPTTGCACPSSRPAGQNCLPADGIGAVSDQLAARLPAASIRLNTPAAAVAGAPAAGGAATVTLADGSSLAAKAVVVAVEGPEAGRLLGPALAAAPSKPAAGVGTCCLYFAAPRPARWGAGLGGRMGAGWGREIRAGPHAR